MQTSLLNEPMALNQTPELNPTIVSPRTTPPAPAPLVRTAWPRGAPSSKEMLRAFLTGDASYTGVFFTGVRTTGIFCLPACTARKPLPQNVEFFPDVKAAMFAGYRPCKRCKPTEISAPAWAVKLLPPVQKPPGAPPTQAALPP